MLRAVPMVHVRVQIPNRDAARVTRAIAGEGLLHLVDIAHGTQPFDAAPPGTRELYAAFRDLQARIGAVASRIGILLPELTGGVAAPADFALEREQVELALQPLEAKAGELACALEEAHRRGDEARRQAQDLESVRRVELDLPRLHSLRYAAVRLGRAPEEAMASLAGLLSPAPFAVIPLAQEGEETFFAVAVAAFAAPRVDEAFRLLNIAACEPSQTVAEPGVREEDVEAQITAFREESRETITNLARRAQVATLLLQAQTFFASAGRFVVISGWVPRNAAERLASRLRSVTEGRAVIDVAPAESLPGVAEGTLRVPILHRNPLLLRPFQKLVDLYGTPSYGEVQPTAFFAAGFLLMFGLMFGDVGHGAVLFAAGWFLFRYMPRFLDYGILLMEAGAASILFGFLYGSVFGIHNLVPVLWLDPIEHLGTFMGVAMAFGVIVVSTGLVLNIVNSWRTHDLHTALLGPKGATGAVLYWIVLVVIARAFVPATARVPDAVIFGLLAIAGAVLIGARFLAPRRAKTPPLHFTPWWLRTLEAGIELVDTLFSYFANTISFVRVAAFAAVHAGVFIAIFALADTIARLRFGGVLSIVVHVAANALVILLEGLTVSVQVLRLEYYEFFGKFFRGGGEVYKPLSLGEEERRHVS